MFIVLWMKNRCFFQKTMIIRYHAKSKHEITLAYIRKLFAQSGGSPGWIALKNLLGRIFTAIDGTGHPAVLKSPGGGKTGSCLYAKSGAQCAHLLLPPWVQQRTNRGNCRRSFLSKTPPARGAVWERNSGNFSTPLR